MPHERPGVVLDCDPGHDDAVAILVAARYAELRGITTVAGNAPLERTTYNARVMRDLLGVDVPVHSGASASAGATDRCTQTWSTASRWPRRRRPPATDDTARRDGRRRVHRRGTCRRHPGTWIVPVGPMTNVALALRLATRASSTMPAGISLMGGGSFGNRSPVAEFNIWSDPEAAAAVFDSGLPLVMAGLDVTHQVPGHPGADRARSVRRRTARIGAGRICSPSSRART